MAPKFSIKSAWLTCKTHFHSRGNRHSQAVRPGKSTPSMYRKNSYALFNISNSISQIPYLKTRQYLKTSKLPYLKSSQYLKPISQNTPISQTNISKFHISTCLSNISTCFKFYNISKCPYLNLPS